MRRQHLGALFLASTALAIGVACGPGFLDGLTDGTDGGGGSEPVDSGPVCDPLVPPARLEGADGTGAELFFAFEQIKIDTQAPGDGGLAPPQGFDLDGLCTCYPSRRACLPADAKGDPDAGDRQCDPDGGRGRDDALGSLFDALLAGIPQSSTDFATERIRQGLFTILVDLRNWNGTDNDQSVDVYLQGSQLLDTLDGGRKTPLFDGTDTWTLTPDSVFDGESKLGKDCRVESTFCNPAATRIAVGQAGNAYVRDGVLVAKFASAPVYISTTVGELFYDTEQPMLVAKLTKDANGRAQLAGEVIGQWRTDKALAAISPLVFPGLDGKSAPLCTQPSFYEIVKTAVCGLADLPLTPDRGADTLCQTLSASIAFRASTVQKPSFVVRRVDGGGPCASFKDDCAP